MNDKQIRQDVIEELEFEPSINAKHIGVAVEDGLVTLAGHVASYAQKIEAEAATQRVNGVRAIALETDVRYPFEKHVEDDRIAKRAADTPAAHLPTRESVSVQCKRAVFF